MGTDAAPQPGFDITDDASPPIAQQRWRAHSRTTGVAGLAAVVLVFTPISINSSFGEPGFSGAGHEIVAFFAALDTPVGTAMEALASLGALVFLWIVVGLSLMLKRIEPHPPLFSTAALASGIVMADLVVRALLAVLDMGHRVLHRAADPSVARRAVDRYARIPRSRSRLRASRAPDSCSASNSS